MPQLTDYITAATRGPYVLELPDGTSISCPQPDVSTWVTIANAETIGDVLRILSGDQADALLAAIGDAPAPVLDAIAADMRKAFGLGN